MASKCTKRCSTLLVIPYVHAKSLQSPLTLSYPMGHSPPGFPVHGILQARILEWVAMPSSRGSSQHRDENCLLYILHWQEGSLPLVPPGNPWQSLSLSLSLSRRSVVSDSCNPVDYSSPDSSVHGILQARILEWVAIFFSRGSSQPRNRTQVSCIAGGFFTN